MVKHEPVLFRNKPVTHAVHVSEFEHTLQLPTHAVSKFTEETSTIIYERAHVAAN